MYYCHCSMCRKASGSSFATNMLVNEADFVVRSGEDLVSSHQSSPGEQRYFCSGCGSPLYSRATARQGVISVRCGTLDDDPPVRPTEHFHVGSKAAWFDICDHVRQYEAEPEP
ncbi:GFA family protein [Frateuria hangzhouensis]|uniref:GFA family protein n=1 Tax=Frateuria hangzhouensis TaxID=2995589 RepID=UPI002260F420|nr:GFA family protein [Frateuria sp. STR12]MCX7514412.1 GFA family protein [Frateuria sp. STR12]